MLKIIMIFQSHYNFSLYIARYPSLDNLFSDLEETEEILETDSRYENEFEDIQELMEDLELGVKSDEMSWENVKKSGRDFRKNG